MFKISTADIHNACNIHGVANYVWQSEQRQAVGDNGKDGDPAMTNYQYMKSIYRKKSELKQKNHIWLF